MILLAYDGYCEEREETERMLFAAAGNPLPAKPKRKPGVRAVADIWRTFARDQNIRQRARARAVATKPNAPG